MSKALAQTISTQIRDRRLRALETVRVSERLARLHRRAVIDVSEARLVDVNQVVEQVIAEAGPLCRSAGVPVVAEQDRRLPRVRLLVEPVRDALAAGLDLLLAGGGPALLRVRTGARGSRAVTLMERWSRRPPADRIWRREDAFPPRPEIVVGESAARAMGGALRVERRGDDRRLRLELPFAERPRSGFEVSFWHGARRRVVETPMELPGH